MPRASVEPWREAEGRRGYKTRTKIKNDNAMIVDRLGDGVDGLGNPGADTKLSPVQYFLMLKLYLQTVHAARGLASRRRTASTVRLPVQRNAASDPQPHRLTRRAPTTVLTNDANARCQCRCWRIGHTQTQSQCDVVPPSITLRELSAPHDNAPQRPTARACATGCIDLGST